MSSQFTFVRDSMDLVLLRKEEKGEINRSAPVTLKQRLLALNSPKSPRGKIRLLNHSLLN